MLFLLLEILSFYFTVQYHSYHKSKFINSSNVISGKIYGASNNINEFFRLKKENKLLTDENVRLKNKLEQFGYTKIDLAHSIHDSLRFHQKYTYLVGKVINNNFTKRNNYLTINKGENSGITSDVGVVSSKGIVGIVKNTSANYATVLSILNSKSRINVRLKNNNHFGTLIWDGKEYNTNQIIDIPRQANIQVGDTIITGGKSAIFPEGIMVGVIENFKYLNNQYEQINITLFNDMSALGQINIIKNLEKTEQQALEKRTINE